jgi:hypothetical protein
MHQNLTPRVIDLHVMPSHKFAGQLMVICVEKMVQQPREVRNLATA